MRTRRLGRGLVLPAALAALVGILATLQYHWLGQLSTAERERLQKSLARQASEFADAFDSEVLWIELAFMSGGALDPDDPDSVGRAFDRWRERARFPKLVRDIYLVDAVTGEPVIRSYRQDERRFVAAEWPAELNDVRSRLVPARAAVLAQRGAVGQSRIQSAVVLVRDPVVASAPALILPVPAGDPTHLSSALPQLPRHLGQAFLIVHLDRDVIRSAILPALADEQFGAHDAGGYKVAIVDGADATKGVFSRGLRAGASLDPARADATALLLSLRPALTARVAGRLGPAALQSADAGGGAASALPHAAAGEPAAGQAVSILVERSVKGNVMRVNARADDASGWRLLVQHPSGSLDAAVMGARRRNLWISFGILAVLGAGVALVVVNARRAERLAAQQMDFVATVSHELRTPLAVIRSAAQNLSAGVVHDAAKTRSYGELIEDEGRRLTDMVEQVLAYAGLTGGRAPATARPLDVGPVLAEVVADRASEAAARGVEVTLEVADGLPSVQADEGALRRAVDNLVGNALKHAAGGRELRVAASANRAKNRDEVVVTVADRGPGVDAADLAHLFEPFYRGVRAVEEQIPGNGLGLSLVKRIVEAHGGRVAATSSPGAGASFTIHLPAAPGSAAGEVVAAPADATG